MRRTLHALALTIIAAPAMAETRDIRLHPAEGAPITVGTLETDAQGAFRVVWDESLFSDHFLSMRPFRCLEGTEKLWCRAPYPYDNPRRIAAGDLTDLEYDLIFVWKGAGDYGISMWNGVYYRLTPAGDGFAGALHEVDLDLLASPPEPDDPPLISEYDLEPGDADSHWLPRISIE